MCNILHYTVQFKVVICILITLLCYSVAFIVCVFNFSFRLITNFLLKMSEYTGEDFLQALEVIYFVKIHCYRTVTGQVVL